jgi:hypothetical protein
MKAPIAAVLAILTLAGCAGQPPASTNAGSTTSTPSAAASPEPLFVMITETGCSASPASIGEVNAGRNVWTVRNQLAGPASFQLMRIDGSYRDAAGWFREAQMGQAPEDEPPFIAKELSRVLVASGARGLLTDELGPGVHAIVCFVLDEHEDIVTAYLAGPFIVADGA